MNLKNTIVGLRKGLDTVVASSGFRTSSSGLVLNHKSNRMKRLHLGKVIIASNMSDVRTAAVVEILDQELTISHGDLRLATSTFSRKIADHSFFKGVAYEIILAARDFLAVITSEGEIIEPEDGFVVIGNGAEITSGAMKALLVHSNLSSEQIVRESLKIASQLHPANHDEISLEVL